MYLVSTERPGKGYLHVSQFPVAQLYKCPSIAKEGWAEVISDFRPIILIHGFEKIIEKILALRFGPFMNHLVSNA
jgi:hypothetical protein